MNSRSPASVLAACCLVLAGCGDPDTPRTNPVRTSGAEATTDPAPLPRPASHAIDVGGHPVRVRLALDQEARFEGLSGVATLGADEGMLFVYPAPMQRGFWMKGCRIPLDIAFLGRDRTVLSLDTLPVPAPGTPDADLPRALPAGPALFVLELPAGWFAAHGLGVGTRVTIPDEVPVGEVE